MKPRLLYIMGIDWEWIYQRPQVLAEKLAADYDVTVVFPRSILNKSKGLPKVNDLKFRILWTVPLQEKNRFIGAISNFLNKSIFDDADEFNIIYIGYPLFARYISKSYMGKVVYDCMDDHTSLYPDKKRVSVIKEHEDKLIKSCDTLFVSSQALKTKVDRIAQEDKGILVRNAVRIRKVISPNKSKIKAVYTLAYIGTVSSWFDEKTIAHSLDKIDNICYLFIGPGEQKINDPRVTYLGKVEHDKLPEVTNNVDCLIMPFVVNDVVKYVDPVKLYEYISFGKCIISVYYDEIKRFEDYVYFYHDCDEYCDLIQELSLKGFPPKYDKAMQEEFMRENTWDKRYYIIKNELAMDWNRDNETI